MKIRVLVNGGLNFDAEVEDIDQFCAEISKSQWLRANDGLIRVAQIVAVLPVVDAPVIAEMSDGK